jgi:hypothetical protein
MYMKGSEGPPATPIRVLWNVRDHAHARISIDLGERYLRWPISGWRRS